METRCCIFIDDNPINQVIFTEALNDISPETNCFTAKNTSVALYMMTEEKVVPSYIFLEHTPPRIDGVEFLKEIKQMDGLKEIPVIVHSITPPPHKIIELRESGAFGIYFRPYEYSSIHNMLNLYFGHK